MFGARPTSRRAWLGRLSAAIAVLALGCLPLQLTPRVQGRVLDESTGAPVAGAVVVVRFDASRDERLPERDLLGHREVLSDAEGRFQVSSGARPGLTAWPGGGAEARVVGVMKDGYQCARPRRVPGSGHVTLNLTPAAGDDDRRASCRPLAASPDEVPEYLTAWRALYPRSRGDRDGAQERELARLARTRATFGFGENCRGPAVDLALAPGGELAGVVVEGPAGRQIEIVTLIPEIRTLTRVQPPADDSRRLGWVSANELVLWEPGSALAPPASASEGASDQHSLRTIWRNPAAPPSPREAGRLPLQPSDFNDSREVRWGGRSFAIVRSLDPETGLGIDTLRISSGAADPVSWRLPGEACGPRGQYGRPHFRIDGAGRRGLDLRYVEGGCHALSIDFSSGDWRRLDSAKGQAALCREARRVPRSHLRSALGDYVAELDTILTTAEADPQGAYSLQIAPNGRTVLSSRDFMGGALRLDVSSFPLRTPLRRIDVSAVAGAASVPAAPAKDLLEPL